MNIAIFHELHSGGARKAVNELAKQLKRKNNVDLYIVDSSNNPNEKNNYNKIYTYKFLSKRWVGGDAKVKLYKDSIELLSLQRLHKKIAKVIDAKGYDLVFVHPSQYTQAPFILRYLNTKSVYYCEEPLRLVYESSFAVNKQMDTLKVLYEKTTRQIKKRIDKTNIKHANFVLANSKFTKKNIKDAYDIDCGVFYLGVDLNFFKPIKQKKIYDILFIGSRDDTDGYPLFEDAVKKIKNKAHIKAHITGENWIKDEKEFVKMYQLSKIVVCLARNEPFGLIPLEAMACAVPVIAVDEGGYRESILNDKTGFLIQRDPLQIAHKLDLLLSNKNLQEKMGHAAREYIVSDWSWEKSAERIQKFFYEITK